jgi:3-methyladenine DNA glycosylase AlkD
MSCQKVKQELRAHADPEKAKVLQNFFKTGKGEYGEGDVFIGVMVPETRMVAKKYSGMPMYEVERLLKSEVHEDRLAAVLILVDKFESGGKEERAKIVDFYLRSRGINNWDLVDLSAHKILGEFLSDREDTSVLESLAKSESLWHRRIAVVSTFAFIRRGIFGDTLNMCEMLMPDKHDLMHKACGWMLRGVGKRDEAVLEGFLKVHSKKMPRTMLRYAIERLPGAKRKKYMAK